MAADYLPMSSGSPISSNFNSPFPSPTLASSQLKPLNQTVQEIRQPQFLPWTTSFLFQPYTLAHFERHLFLKLCCKVICDVLLESVVSAAQISGRKQENHDAEGGEGGAGFLSEMNPDPLSLDLL